MLALEARNRKFLADLFAGPFRGHAIVVNAPQAGFEKLGDFLLSQQPVSDWVPTYAANYQARVRQLEVLQDDAVPYVPLTTTTGLFAATFGCSLHVYAGHESGASARPMVSTAAEADKLVEPEPFAPPLHRVFELARLLRRELGPEVSLGVPDIQSPFDIAALIWNKEDFFLAMVEDPEAVKRLVGKCHRLLTRFLQAFLREFPECNLCHCPNAWAPPRLGCWLSEDEVGAISTSMFAEFCLPVLSQMSRDFGGLFMHCCATADHQYNGFKQIPNLRGLNRVFQAPGPKPAIDAFAGRTVLMQAWTPEEDLNRMLDLARPETRFLFNLDAPAADLPPDRAMAELTARYERLRKRCPRR